MPARSPRRGCSESCAKYVSKIEQIRPTRLKSLIFDVVQGVTSKTDSVHTGWAKFSPRFEIARKPLFCQGLESFRIVSQDYDAEGRAHRLCEGTPSTNCWRIAPPDRLAARPGQTAPPGETC